MDQKHQTGIKKLKQKILELRMLQCSFEKTREQFDSTQKKIQVLQKELENLKRRLNETTIIRLSTLIGEPLFFTGDSGFARKGRILNKKKKKKDDQEFNKLKLGNEEIDDSRTGFYKFNEPDLGIWTDIEGLGEKMHELMNKNQEEMQSDHPIVREHLVKWIQASDDSDEEVEAALQSIKSKAMDLGTKISHMLVDFVFSTSMNAKQLIQKFQSCLGRCCEADDCSPVISRISMLLEMTIGEISLVNTKSVKDNFLEIEENRIDRIIHELVHEIIRLRYIIIELEVLPESWFSKGEVLALLEVVIKQCREKLEEMELEGIGFIDVSLKDSNHTRSESETQSSDAVKSMIYQLWKIFWLSEDANHSSEFWWETSDVK